MITAGDAVVLSPKRRAPVDAEGPRMVRRLCGKAELTVERSARGSRAPGQALVQWPRLSGAVRPADDPLAASMQAGLFRPGPLREKMRSGPGNSALRFPGLARNRSP